MAFPSTWWVIWTTETEPEEGLSNSVPETPNIESNVLWRVQGHPEKVTAF